MSGKAGVMSIPVHVRLAWLLGVIACGGGTSNLTMDAPSDATSDATPMGDAPLDAFDPSSRVEIKVFKEDGSGDLATTAIAVFRNQADQVIQAGPVDANAVAFAFMPTGGSVTVHYVLDNPLDLSQRDHQITTIRGVKPGDRLQAGILRSHEYRVGAQTGMTATFTPFPSSSTPYLLSSCGGTSIGTSNTVSMSFLASCVTPTFDLLTVHDGNDLIRRYVWQTGVVYASGGAFTIPNTWQPIAHNATTILNVPPGLTRVFGTLFAVVGGKPLELERQPIEAPAAGTHMMSLMHAPGAGSSTIVTVGLTSGFSVPETHVQVTTGSAANMTIDLGALPLPKLGTAGTGGISVSWSQTGPASGDARLIRWYGNWTDSNSIRHSAAWHIVEAPDASTTSVLPPFPVAYAADDPTLVGGFSTLGAVVQYVDYDNLADYDAARPYGYQLYLVEERFPEVAHHAHASRSR